MTKGVEDRRDARVEIEDIVPTDAPEDRGIGNGERRFEGIVDPAEHAIGGGPRVKDRR